MMADAIAAIIAPTAIGQGNWTATIPPDLLTALTAAYREAAGGTIHTTNDDGG